MSTTSSDPNALLDKITLRNEYCALRHGQSMANVQQIISSSPQVATVQHGLSDMGQEQANKAGQDVIYHFSQQEQKQYKGIAVISSDFLRAKETAQCVVDAVLKCPETMDVLYKNKVVLEPRLRERYFGSWDGGSDDNYHKVWKDDAVNADHTVENVESVHSVMQRTTECILEYDEQLENFLIISVAHGDVLQILQTAFSKLHGTQHRTLQHLETATLRPLQLAKTSTQ